MSKAIVVEDAEIDHVVKVAKASSRENGVRNAALLLTGFGTGMTVTELARIPLSAYLKKDGTVLRDSEIAANIAYNGKKRPVCWTNKRVVIAIDAYLDDRRKRHHGLGRTGQYRGLNPNLPLFLSGRTGEPIKLTEQRKSDKVFYSANQFSALFKTLFEQAGVYGATATSMRRTLAVKLGRKGIDPRHISEILGVESLLAVKKLCDTDPVKLGELVRGII